MILLFVKTFIIGHLLPFSLSDSADVRLFFECCAHTSFPRSKLYPRMVKHYLVEVYKATVSSFSHRLQSAVAGAGGPALHANFDLWTSQTSNKKYIGETQYGCMVHVAFCFVVGLKKYSNRWLCHHINHNHPKGVRTDWRQNKFMRRIHTPTR